MTDTPPSSVPPSPAVPDAVLAELARLAGEAPPGPCQLRQSADDPREWWVEFGPRHEDSTVLTEAGARYLAAVWVVVPALAAELAARRAADAEAPEPSHPCQICGKPYPDRYLFDLKGNVPGGCKVTCLECRGRLEERERAAQIADAVFRRADSCLLSRHAYPTAQRAAAREIAAAIRGRGG